MTIIQALDHMIHVMVGFRRRKDINVVMVWAWWAWRVGYGFGFDLRRPESFLRVPWVSTRGSPSTFDCFRCKSLLAGQMIVFDEAMLLHGGGDHRTLESALAMPH